MTLLPVTDVRLRLRLLGLLGVACVAFVGATDSVMRAVSVALLLTLPFFAGAAWREWRALRVEKAAAAELPSEQQPESFQRTKRILLLMIAAGVVAWFGGSGTFSVFSAETTNAGSAISTGTLTMDNQVPSKTLCLSYGGPTQDNNNGNCAGVLSLANIAPGVFAGAQSVTIRNTGSLDAAHFYLSASYVNSTLANPLPPGTYSSITVNPLEGPVADGDSLTISYGALDGLTVVANGNSGGVVQPCTTTSPYTCSSQTINVSSFTVPAGTTYPAGSHVTDTSSNTTVDNTDCYDAPTNPNDRINGSSVGSELGFNPIAHNPLCSTARIWIQEQTNGKNFCWYGLGSTRTGGFPNPLSQASAGMCRAPISNTLQTALAANASIGGSCGSGTHLALSSPLAGNVTAGDSIKVTDPTTTNNSQTFVAGQNTYIGATSICINAATVNATGFGTNAVVTDTTTLTAIAAQTGTKPTISNFDTSMRQSARQELYPLTANGTATTTSPVELNRFGDTGSSRTFWVGVYLPDLGAQNPLQGLRSTFSLTWHIDQT